MAWRFLSPSFHLLPEKVDRVYIMPMPPHVIAGWRQWCPD